METKDSEGEGDVVVTNGDSNGNGEMHGEDEEDSSDDFFDAGEGAIISPNRLPLDTTSKSSQNGSCGGTKDDPVLHNIEKGWLLLLFTAIIVMGLGFRVEPQAVILQV